MSRPAFQGYAPGEAVPGGEGAYVVGERIGHGGFGSIYACRDDWGNPRRLRVLWPISRSYESVRESWLAQVEAVRRAGHPNLIQVCDGFEHGGFFHLVTERYDHRLDSSILEAGGDSAGWFEAVAGAVLGALDHIHRAGYTHRNLHPGNIFLAAAPECLGSPEALFSGAIKLGGLSVTHLLGNVDVLSLFVARGLVPPEYLNPSEFGSMDHRVDIYQAGLLLLSVLQGHIPRFTFEEIVAGTPARAAQELGHQALARALQPKVADRFPSVFELWRALAISN